MAGARITINVEDETVIAALNDLARRATTMTPAMREIGEAVTRQTKTRIESGGPAPSGTPWAPLSPVTIARKGDQNPDKVLIYHGYLLGDIHYQPTETSVRIGTSRKYGAAMQFGMPRGYAGTMKNGSPIPWGDIPPRPYLGLSDSDADTVTVILRRYLAVA